MPEQFFQHTFDNGLTLLVEQTPAMQSAAMVLAVPAGSAFDPVDGSGTATVLSDLVLRGAGPLDSRELTEHLDRLGLQRSSSVGVHHTHLTCAAVAGRVIESLRTYADIVRRPHLPASGFEAARELSLAALAGIEDEPRQKVLIKLREWHFPWPYGRSTLGQQEELEKLTLDLCRAHQRKGYHARGSILAIAGRVQFDEVRREVARWFGDWEPGEAASPRPVPPPGRVRHETHPSEQTHMGIAYPSVTELDPDYYAMRLAVEALSGGMSGRLFTEVRERRALAYNVWAGYVSLKHSGSIMGYAGTSNDRAQATLDCFIEQVVRLGRGITADELDRAKTALKAATVMQGESTSARAGALAHDYFVRGRIRTVDEIKAAIDAVTLARVNDWLAANPPGPFTIVTVGPEPLQPPG